MDTVLLDVAIGLTVVFFVVASIVAGGNELATRLLDTRAKAMWKAIEHAIDPTAGAPLTLGFGETLGWAFGRNDRRPSGGSSTVTGLVANSPIVDVLGGRTGVVGRSGRTRVDQVAGDAFARAVLYVGSVGANAAGIAELRAAVRAAAAVEAEAVTGEVISQAARGWPLVARVAADEAVARSGLDDALEALGTAAAPLIDSLVAAAGALRSAETSNDATSRQQAASMLATLRPEAQRRLVDMTQLDLVRIRSAYAGTPIGTVVDQVVGHTADEVADLTAAISTWFDGYMARLSELYRLATRKILAVAGIVLAAVFNINAITLITELRENADFRRALTEVAAECAPDRSNSTTAVTGDELQQCADEAKAAYDGAAEAIHLPILGKPQDLRQSFGDGDLELEWSDIAARHTGASLLGWLTTGIAVSFGAPFWFDVMQGLVSLRKRVS